MSQEHPLKLLHPLDVQRRFGLTPSMLRRMRAAGDGPPYLKTGPRNSAVLYPVGGVASWFRKRLHPGSLGTRSLGATLDELAELWELDELPDP